MDVVLADLVRPSNFVASTTCPVHFVHLCASTGGSQCEAALWEGHQRGPSVCQVSDLAARVLDPPVLLLVQLCLECPLSLHALRCFCSASSRRASACALPVAWCFLLGTAGQCLALVPRL